MAAEFKSHVLRRDEKGFFGIPFRRVLLSAVSGGAVYSVLRFTQSDWTIPAGLTVGVVVLILTAPRHGLPRWQRMLMQLRGALVRRARAAPNGIAGSLARTLDLPTDLLTLDERIFAEPDRAEGPDVAAWSTYRTPVDADRDDRLRVVESPVERT